MAPDLASDPAILQAYILRCTGFEHLVSLRLPVGMAPVAVFAVYRFRSASPECRTEEPFRAVRWCGGCGHGHVSEADRGRTCEQSPSQSLRV